MIRNILAGLLLVLLVASGSYCQDEQQSQEDTNVLADLVANGFVLSVNADAISSYDIIQIVYKQLEEIGVADYRVFYTKAYPIVNQTVHTEIYDILMYQYSRLDMEKQGVDEKAIAQFRDKRKSEIIREYGGIEPLVHLELEKQGTTMEAELDKYQRRMIVSSYREVYMSTDRTVSRVEMVDYYNKNKDKFTIPAKMQFSLIELDSQAVADEIYAKVVAGEDFAGIAKSSSKDWRAPYGGLWNEVDPDSLRKIYLPVVEKLKTLAPGAVTPVINSGDKFFIGKLESYTPSRLQAMSEVQDTIKKDIYELRWQEYSQKLNDNLMQKAQVGDINTFVAGTIYTAWKKLGGVDIE